ncbi:MAG: hypothetical protein ACFE8P_13905, partial [Promethearchaeota archaeon]
MMKSSRRWFLLIVILVLFIAIPCFFENSANLNNEFNDNNGMDEKKENLKMSWILSFIYIDNNFTNSEWCMGYGNSTHPYIIENVIINGAGRETCVLIKNTRDYFVIRNCLFSNARVGIKIMNATNLTIFNVSIFNLRGINGMDGMDASSYANGTAGTIANPSIGIFLTDCVDSNVSFNKIYDIIGGNGGDGGNGGNGAGIMEPGSLGGNGGDGGNAYGIFINNSKEIFIEKNDISNMLGGVGGNGVNGGKGGTGTTGFFNFGRPGGMGGTGGAGGISSGIILDYSQNLTIIKNNMYSNVGGLGGTGGVAGKGGDKGEGPGPGSGGFGGFGGLGGIVSGIWSINSQYISNHQNIIYSSIGGLGGIGGEGGVGGDAYENYAPGIGGMGGFGGIGGTAVGICLTTSQEISNFNCSIFLISGGNGGNGGLGGDGGSRYGVPQIGQGGYGGDGGSGGISIGLNALDCINIINLWNTIQDMIFGFGGSGGPPGIGSSPGYPGYDGYQGTAYGFISDNTNNSKTYYNSIYCQNNTDTGYYNEWDNGRIGNFWSYYSGGDDDPKDGFGDIPYVLNADTSSQDNHPFVYEFYGDFDGDTIVNYEEAILGIDNYITNITNADTDYDTFSDSLEFDYLTNPVDNTWYPMPNLIASRFLLILNNNSNVNIALEVANNGIWKAEDIYITIRCEAQDLLLYNGSIDLDIDNYQIIEIMSIPIS